MCSPLNLIVSSGSELCKRFDLTVATKDKDTKNCYYGKGENAAVCGLIWRGNFVNRAVLAPRSSLLGAHSCDPFVCLLHSCDLAYPAAPTTKGFNPRVIDYSKLFANLNAGTVLSSLMDGDSVVSFVGILLGLAIVAFVFRQQLRRLLATHSLVKSPDSAARRQGACVELMRAFCATVRHE